MPSKIVLSIILLLYASVFLLFYTVYGIYRLYFSPLAKIPGPKWAALTFWYQFYYDIIR